MFGVPSGVIFDPLGRSADVPGRIGAGHLLAALEPPRPDPALVQVASGRLEAIFIATQAGAPMRPLNEVRAIAGRGLQGDRSGLPPTTTRVVAVVAIRAGLRESV
jgi:hypothetical protein